MYYKTTTPAVVPGMSKSATHYSIFTDVSITELLMVSTCLLAGITVNWLPAPFRFRIKIRLKFQKE